MRLQDLALGLALTTFVHGCSGARGAGSSSAPGMDEPTLSAAREHWGPGKGPAHTSPLPAPGARPWRYREPREEWRYVAPPQPERLYDALYFEGEWYVLHGLTENSLKVTTRELNWLSRTRDGSSWTTDLLTDRPYTSYGRLASNGRTLLLAGTRGVARLENREVRPIASLAQDTATPVLVAAPDGYVVARRDDVLWLANDGTLTTTYERPLAQFRVGVYAAGSFLLIGPFVAVMSTDERSFREVDTPCAGCNLTSLAFGNGTYVASDGQSLFTSRDGATWDAHVWERAITSTDVPEDERGEDQIIQLDFTGGHFTLLTRGGNTSLSRDGVSWTDQLKIPLGQIGPAPCEGRCVVANGRLLLPPFVLADPSPPSGADVRAPYYCPYGLPPPAGCFDCGGATITECREGVICRRSCTNDADCPRPGGGSARVVCASTQVGGECMLRCDSGAACPSGMSCSGGSCLYEFDDPRCGDGLVTPMSAP